MSTQIFSDIDVASNWIGEQGDTLTPFSAELLRYIAPKMIRKYGSVETSFLLGLHVASGQIALGINIDPNKPIIFDSPEEEKLITFGNKLFQCLNQDETLKGKIMDNNKKMDFSYPWENSDPGIRQ